MEQLDLPRVTQYYREKVVDHAIHLLSDNKIPTLSKLKVNGNKVFIKNMKKVIKYYNKVIKKLSPKYHQKDIIKLEQERDGIQQTLDNPNDARLRILKNLEADFVAKDVYAPDLDDEADDDDDVQPGPTTKEELATESIQEVITTTASVEACGEPQPNMTPAIVVEEPMHSDSVQLSVEAPACPDVDSLQVEKEPLQAHNAPLSPEGPAVPNNNSLRATESATFSDDIDNETFAPAGWLGYAGRCNEATTNGAEVSALGDHGDVGAKTASSEPQQALPTLHKRTYDEMAEGEDYFNYSSDDDYDVYICTEDPADSEVVDQVVSVDSGLSALKEASFHDLGPATLWGILSSSSPVDLSHAAPDLDPLETPKPSNIVTGNREVIQMPYLSINNVESSCETIDNFLDKPELEQLTHYVEPQTQLGYQVSNLFERTPETDLTMYTLALGPETSCDQPEPLAEDTALAGHVEEPDATVPILPFPSNIVEALGDAIQWQAQAAAEDTKHNHDHDNVFGPATLWGILVSESELESEQQVEKLPATPTHRSPTPCPPESPTVDVAVCNSDEPSFSEDALAALDEACSRSSGKDESSSEEDEDSLLPGSPLAKTFPGPQSAASTTPTTPVKDDGDDQEKLDYEELVEDFFEYGDSGSYLEKEATESEPESENDLIAENSISVKMEMDNGASEDQEAETAEYPSEPLLPAEMPGLAVENAGPINGANLTKELISSATEELTVPVEPKSHDFQEPTDPIQAPADTYEPPKWSINSILGCTVAITVPMVIIYPAILVLGVYGLIRYARSRCS